MGGAVLSVLAAGKLFTTLELKVNYVRTLTSETGAVRAEGRVINAGRTIATAEGRLLGADGRLYAHGTTTCLILSDPSGDEPNAMRRKRCTPERVRSRIQFRSR